MMMAEDGGRPKSPLRRKSSILELERRKKEKQKEIIDDSGGGSSSRWPKLAFFYPKSHATDFNTKRGKSKADTSKKADSRLLTKRKRAEKATKMMKKAKADKDPNKPKRPPSAFFVFM
ncbi:hypothetical protein COCNU_01G020380 [Cocos nucifera]|uniref:Uncharacterized protein n=1 Tax=Cocos nucifera TaxID=13894 RepID=A0A8K0MVX2_COCNU|nr:hypothetical protein COCNU_01G020380 [Cocos nucifera]